MNPKDFELTLEQSFQMQLLRQSVESVSPEQLKEYVLQLTTQNMVKDNLIKSLIKNEWVPSHLP